MIFPEAAQNDLMRFSEGEDMSNKSPKPTMEVLGHEREKNTGK